MATSMSTTSSVDWSRFPATRLLSLPRKSNHLLLSRIVSLMKVSLTCCWCWCRHNAKVVFTSCLCAVDNSMAHNYVFLKNSFYFLVFLFLLFIIVILLYSWLLFYGSMCSEQKHWLIDWLIEKTSREQIMH